MASTRALMLMIITTLQAVLLLLQTTAAQPAAPAPSPPGAVNLTAILEKGGQFSSLLRLLNKTRMGDQITIQLNSSTQGLTLFAPTDNAFQNLPPGSLNRLDDNQQVQLVLYHVLPKFYTLTELLSVSNPVRTQAAGDNGPFGLNFTGQGNQLNVSTGVVETRINNALRDDFPLAVYVVDSVLLPEEYFGKSEAPTGAPKPKSKTPAPSGSDESTASSNKAPGPAGDDTGSAGGKATGLFLGLAVFGYNLLLLLL